MCMNDGCRRPKRVKVTVYIRGNRSRRDPTRFGGHPVEEVL